MSIIVQKALRDGVRRAVDQQSKTDWGPEIRIKRKEVEKGDGPCPDNPSVTVRRARLVVAYEVLWRSNSITDEQREACDRYLVEAERAEGARNRPEMPVGRAPPWQQGHPSEMQVRATVALRAARSAVGCDARALLDMLIIGNLSVRLIAERRRSRRDTVVMQLQEALTSLCDHWSI